MRVESEQISIDDLQKKFGVATDEALAGVLGLGRSTVTSWRRRGRVPDIYARLAPVIAGQTHGFGQQLRAMRGQRSQESFARVLGITRAALANYETGRTTPHIQEQDRLIALAAVGSGSGEEHGSKVTAQLAATFEAQLDTLFERYGAHSYDELAAKIGVSRSAVGNWVSRRSIPERYLKAPVACPQPWQVPAALSVLRDQQVTDAEARKVALSFLQQLEAQHA